MREHELTSDECLVFGALSHKPKRLVDLMYETGREGRAIQQAIEDLRRGGWIAICSGGAGYWLPRTSHDYAINVEGRRRRALHQLLTVRGERALLRRMKQEEAGPLAFSWRETA